LTALVDNADFGSWHKIACTKRENVV
jgi:hypothetical protein